MDRVEDAVDRAWDGLPVAVRQEGRDLAFMHPGNRVHVQAGLSLPLVAVVPRPLLQAAPVVAGAKNEDVTLGKPHSLRLLGSFQVGTCHRVARLQVRHAAQAWDVEQYAPPDDAVGVGRDS